MLTRRMLHNTAWCLSLLLGQASVLLGVMLSLGWTLALALIVPPKGVPWSAGPRFLLPLEPPLIGLAVGFVALLLAWTTHERVSRFALAGLILNALPLALTLLLISLK